MGTLHVQLCCIKILLYTKACYPINSSRHFFLCFTVVQVQCSKRMHSNSRQSFPALPSFYEHFHNGISNTWAVAAVTAHASSIITCSLLQKTASFIAGDCLCMGQTRLEIPKLLSWQQAGFWCPEPCSSLGLCSPRLPPSIDLR